MRTNRGVKVWNPGDTVPLDIEGGYAGGDSTADAIAAVGDQAYAAQQTIQNLAGSATTLPPGSAATVTVTGSGTSKTINVGVPRGANGTAGANGTNGADGMGYAEGVALLADSQQVADAAQSAAADADAAADRAEAAEATALKPADEVIAAAMGNPATDTHAALTTTVGQVITTRPPDNEQTDFVAMAERWSPYSGIEVKKVTSSMSTGTGLEVTCYAQNGDHVTYEIDNGYRTDNFMTIGGIWVGDSAAPALVPDPTPYPVNALTDYKPGAMTTTGVWSKTGTWVTNEVGATWTLPVTTASKATAVSFRGYVSPRGGIWEIEVVDHPEIDVATVSLWAATEVGAYNVPVHPAILTIPKPGTYTIRGTFKGDDPNNAPIGGVSRGFLLPAAEATYSVRLSTTVTPRNKTTTLKLATQIANQEFALTIRGVGDTAYRFIPDHNQGEQVERRITAPAYYDGATPVDVDAMAVGDVRELKHGFEVVQHFAGRNTTTGPDLVEVRTKLKITPQGLVNVAGAVKTALPVQVTKAMYMVEFPLSSAVFHSLHSAWGNTYDMDPANHPALSTTVFDVERNRTVGWAGTSPTNPNVLAAVRFNNLAETLRANVSEHPDPTFIEHTSTTRAKLYPRLGYLDGEVVPAGTVWRYSGDYFYGEAPSLGRVIAP